MVRFIEKIPDKNPDDLKLPDSIFMLTDTLLIFDHVDHAIKVVSNAHVKGDPSKSYDEAVRKIDGIVANFKIGSPKSAKPHLVMRRASPVRLKSNYTKTEYENAVRVAKEYVKRGDIIQVVLSQRLQIPISSHPFQIYRALRSINT